MLMVRLQRIGKRGQAYFRIVVTEHTTKPKGRYLELLGSYDPHKKTLNAKADRIKHWLSVGAKLSPTVNNLLINNKVIEGQKVKAWKAKSKRAETAGTPTAGVGEKPTEAKSEETSPKIETPVETSATLPAPTEAPAA